MVWFLVWIKAYFHKLRNLDWNLFRICMSTQGKIQTSPWKQLKKAHKLMNLHISKLLGRHYLEFEIDAKKIRENACKEKSDPKSPNNDFHVYKVILNHFWYLWSTYDQQEYKTW